jgi:hypothetical protein
MLIRELDYPVIFLDCIRIGDFAEAKRLLLSKKIDVNQAHENIIFQRPALHLTVRTGHTDFAEELISLGADINLKDYNGLTPLHHAVLKGIYKNVVLLLGQENIDINSIDDKGNTALHYAAGAGYSHNSIIELLLMQPKIEIKTNFNEETLLHCVAKGYQDNFFAVEDVLPLTKDINARDKHGLTALHYAAISKKAVVAKLLVKNGADLKIQILDKIENGANLLLQILDIDEIFEGYKAGDTAEDLLVQNGLYDKENKCFKELPFLYTYPYHIPPQGKSTLTDSAFWASGMISNDDYVKAQNNTPITLQPLAPEELSPISNKDIVNSESIFDKAESL